MHGGRSWYSYFGNVLDLILKDTLTTGYHSECETCKLVIFATRYYVKKICILFRLLIVCCYVGRRQKG